MDWVRLPAAPVRCCVVCRDGELAEFRVTDGERTRNLCQPCFAFSLPEVHQKTRCGHCATKFTPTTETAWCSQCLAHLCKSSTDCAPCWCEGF